MSKVNYFKILFIVLLVSASIPFLCNFQYRFLSYAQTDSDYERYVNEETYYNYIENPNLLSGVSNSFFVLDANQNLFEYKGSNNFNTIHSFSNLTDFRYLPQTNKVLTIENGNLFEYNALDFDNNNQIETISNAKLIDTNSSYLIVSSNNEIEVTLSNESITFTKFLNNEFSFTNFSNIKDICLYNNTLYILDANELTSRVLLVSVNLANDFINSVPVQVKQISVNVSSNFEMKGFQNGLLINEGNILKHFDLNGNYVSTLTDTYTNYEISAKSGDIVVIGDFFVDGNQIVISDKFSNSIQLFEISNNSLVFKKLLIASSGSDVDRLSNATSLTCLDENSLLISDYGNRRIIYKNLLYKTLSAIELSEKPSLIASNNNKEIYAYARPYIYFYPTIDSEPQKLELQTYNIVDMQFSSFNELYFIDSNSKSLYKYINQNNQQLIYEFIDLDLKSKVNIDANGKNAYVLAGNTLHIIDIASKTEIDCIECLDNVLDFALDYKSNIYFLIQKTTDLMQINKYVNYVLDSYKLLEKNNYINLELNLNTGKFYAIDNVNSAVAEIYMSDFTENLIEFINDLSFIDENTTTTGATIAKTKTKTTGYKYPFMISPILEIENNSLVVVLDKACSSNPQFSYCLIANVSNENELVYIPNENLNFEIEDRKPAFDNIKIITAYSYIYKLPTTLKLSNGKDLKLEKIAYKNEIYPVIGYANDYKDKNGNSFYCIKLEDDTLAYIRTFNAMNANLDVYQETFQPNAHLSKINKNDKIEIYSFNDNNYSPTGTFLKNGTKVYVADYDINDKTFTKVVYKNENNEQISAYVQTKFIVMETITTHMQIGIILLFVSIALIILVAIFAINYVKQRKMANTLSSIDTSTNH